jgi:hypothetical protein
MKALKIVIAGGLLASTAAQARPYEYSGNSGREWCEAAPDHERLTSFRFFVWFLPCNGHAN